MSDTSPNDVTPIDDVNELASKLIQWHSNRVARLNNMLEVPVGTEVDFEDGETLTLEGPTHSAFRLGIEVALHELGRLPIVAEYEAND